MALVRESHIKMDDDEGTPILVAPSQIDMMGSYILQL